MSVDGISSNISRVSSYLNIIPDQPSKVSEGNDKSFFQVCKQYALDNESSLETLLIRTDNGNIGSIDIVIDDNVNYTANKLCDALNNSKPYVEIKSSDLNTAGYTNIHNIEFVA